MANAVSLAVEEFVEPNLELVLDGREQERGKDRRADSRQCAARLEIRTKKLPGKHDHRDDGSRREDVSHAALEDDIDVHQLVAMDRVTEGRRDQHQREYCDVHQRVGHDSRRARHGLQKEEGNDTEGHTAGNPFHLLT